MTEQIETIATAKFAAIVGLTPRRIQQLIAEDILPSAGHGKMPLADAIRAFITWRVESETRALLSDGPNDLEAERTRKLRIENDGNERRTVRMDDAIAALDAIIGAFPADLAPVSARATDDISIRRRIDDEIDIALNGLSQRFAEAGAALRQGRDPLGQDGQDDAERVGAQS